MCIRVLLGLTGNGICMVFEFVFTLLSRRQIIVKSSWLSNHGQWITFEKVYTVQWNRLSCRPSLKRLKKKSKPFCMAVPICPYSVTKPYKSLNIALFFQMKQSDIAEWLPFTLSHIFLAVSNLGWKQPMFQTYTDYAAVPKSTTTSPTTGRKCQQSAPAQTDEQKGPRTTSFLDNGLLGRTGLQEDQRAQVFHLRRHQLG